MNEPPHRKSNNDISQSITGPKQNIYTNEVHEELNTVLRSRQTENINKNKTIPSTVHHQGQSYGNVV